MLRGESSPICAESFFFFSLKKSKKFCEANKDLNANRGKQSKLCRIFCCC